MRTAEIAVKTEILMVGEQMAPLVEVSRQLDGSAYAITIAQVPHCFDYLLKHRARRPDGVIIRLSGRENVADLRAVCSAYPESALVFLADRFPPRPAVARIVDQYHCVILRATESPLSIVANMVALMFQRRVE